ncbi:MAG: hypothetical protein A2219_08100, partial [Elusimicrobia bacterium RIFOXYA2_FULL_50_26]
ERKGLMNIENILPLVQRPGRYIDGEWNAVKKDLAGGVSLCLCFPDLYEIGASNLGLEILYHIVNARADAVAERCYTPAQDMENELRASGLPLFSLETNRPLNSFDIVGFTLQYELCATNVINMLDMAGLAPESAARRETFPLVIGGGPATANPEPYAAFFDCFVLGDGEDVTGEIIETVKKFKAQRSDKKELLLALAKIPGVYVPSLYDVTYNADGTVAAVKPVSPDVPEKISKRTVKLEEAPFPAAQIVPLVQTVHNRLNVEIARGCARRCRFCQATRYYGPWRLRSGENVLDIVEKGLASTGYEEVAFSSLSCTDYGGLDELLATVSSRYSAQRISLSVPSLRCDLFSLKIADSLSHNKRSSLTFAPEAATERLRNVIGKELTGQQIHDTLALAWRMGWRLIKLYFMVGLPTETDADIGGIGGLLRAVRRNAPRLNFNVTVSPFVPKAHTPFQWVAMAQAETLKARMAHLAKTLPASVKCHPLEGSLLEGVFARGDRRLSAAILAAWRMGCRFDQWREKLRFDLWQNAFKETGIDPAFYLYRERGREETLPWDHLQFAASRQELLADYDKGLEFAASEEPAAVYAPVGEPPAAVAAAPSPSPGTAVLKLRLRFARHGMARFTSHLEQIEMFRRALRRAGLPLVYTSGFHPQPKISFGPAISVGYESNSEYVEAELSRRIEQKTLEAAIAASLPAGFALVGAKRIPVFFPSLDSLVNVAVYSVACNATRERVESFMSAGEIIVEKVKNGRVERIDAKPLIRRLEIVNGGVELELRFGPKKNIKPERIIALLCDTGEQEAKILRINRTGLFIEKKDGSISEP